ncbi:glycoside hydrolase family 6 protein [Actinomycetes bacterium KLBMP 9759]
MVRPARHGLPAVTAALAVAVGVLSPPAAAAAAVPEPVLGPRTTLFTPPPKPEALAHIADVAAGGNAALAAKLTDMVTTPQAYWLAGDTPANVEHRVRTVTTAAAALEQVPVLVAYNVPFRDCAQFSAGGATDTRQYLEWISAFAKGIENRKAVVILEPDGLGIIPFHRNIQGRPEWCQPPGADPATAADERYRQLNRAVDVLGELPGTKVYLDGTHIRWIGAGDMAKRLAAAGVDRADGFFLNVSNFQTDAHNARYALWVSSCLAFAANPDDGGRRLGHYEWCAGQYHPAKVDDESTWYLTDEWYAGNLGRAKPTTRYVSDTSRNAHGPWAAPDGHPPGDPQIWCNPPGRGLGVEPTARTHSALLDAYLWIKIPGDSDGECNRWNPPGAVDPVRGKHDPRAGAWFPDLAVELVTFAGPSKPPDEAQQ